MISVFSNSLEHTMLEGDSVLSPSDRSILIEFGKTKRKIAIAVKQKYGFFCQLHGFHENRPGDVAMVAFVPEKSRENVTPESEKCFDLIIYYDDSKNTFEGLNSWDDIELPNLHRFADELVKLVPKEKIVFIHCEEFSQPEVCRVRERHGLEGAYLADLNHIRNKDVAMALAKKNGIPTAKSLIFNASELNCEIEFAVDKIEAYIGGYPMFRRATSMSLSRGAEKIPSRDAFVAWMQTELDRNSTNNFLIEEFLTGREFLATVILLPDGSYEPLVVKYLEFGFSNVQHIQTGRPIPALVDSFYNSEVEFPNLLHFVAKVIAVFNPPAPQIFSVQGYQRTLNGDDYVLVEMAHRPTGARTNTACNQSCGISQETALFRAHIDPNYRPKVDPCWKRPRELALWFPERKGVLESYTPMPDRENVKSEITAKWLKPLGTVMRQPVEVDKQMLILTLKCEDRAQLLEDAKWIADNWRPVVNDD